jgi:D-3-phosphoglycerate dehydrogenase
LSKKILILATTFYQKLPDDGTDKKRGSEILEKFLQTEQGRKFIVVDKSSRNPHRPLKREEFEGVVAVIADLEKYTREILFQIGRGKGGSLELIARYGVGVSSVDLTAAREAGVLVSNCPGSNSRAVAERALQLAGELASRAPHQFQLGRKGRLKQPPPRLDLTGRIFGIVGLGRIGRELVDLLRGFRPAQILAYDPVKDEKWAAENSVKYVGLNTLCQQADIISLHATGEKVIISQPELLLMKPTAILVNTARRGLVDEEAVIKRVKEKKIWGYAQDDLMPPEILNQLSPADNIIINPHVASDSADGIRKMGVMSAQAVVEYLSGGKPQYLVVDI